jgi:hypothetical protein
MERQFSDRDAGFQPSGFNTQLQGHAGPHKQISNMSREERWGDNNDDKISLNPYDCLSLECSLTAFLFENYDL